MTSITVEGLRKVFSVPSGTEVAVDDIDFEMEDGEFISFVGPSGCGKTTTLRCIAGLETPTGGSVWFGDDEVTQVPANKRQVAMMFQNIALYPHMTIRENIAYPLKVRHISKSERHEQAKEAAEIMQISELLDKYPGELSGGQRQRAALARTVIQDPVVFLMDEPLSDLDAKLKADIRQEIQRIHKRIGKTTVYVTHDQEEAMTMSDRIAVMNNGTIMQSGTPDELYKRPINQFVAQFIGNPSMNFLQSDVVSTSGDSITIKVGDNTHTFKLDEKTPPSNSIVTIGFRPEAISFRNHSEEDITFDAKVSLMEYIGDRLLVTLDGPQGNIRAATDPNQILEEDSVVKVSVDKAQVHIFDTESGDAIKNSYLEDVKVQA